MKYKLFHPEPLCLLAVLCFCPLSVMALTPAEQADDFFAHGLAEEQRGETQAAWSCYELALRAFPAHHETIAKLAARAKKKADDLVAQGSSAEAKGDLQTANLQYVLALDASPGHAEAGKKVAELKKKMGVAFKEGGELVLRDKLNRIILPRIDFEDTIYRGGCRLPAGAFQRTGYRRV